VKRAVMSFAILAVLLARPLLAGDSMATYEVTLTATGASSGVKAAARGVAAAYGATVEPGEINEDRRTFVVRMKPESAALMRGDPRIQSTRPLQSRAHVSTILPPMDLGVYLYDGAGNIESIGNDQFRYDEAGRLKSATVNGSANQQTFTYDAFGNRKDAARAASASVCIGNTNCEMAAPVETTNTNHLTAATYDDAGNVQVLDGTYSYSYDALNMVKSTGGREYVYTADDERIATVSGGGWTWTIRSPGQQVLSEFTSSGTNGASNWRWTRDHIWRGASLLAVEEKNASDVTVTRHFHLDHLGTPRLITNGTGQQIGLHAYYPFGTELLSSTTEAPPDNIKFTGHEWDDLGGDIHALTYMHARSYSAALGRFLSVDPVEGDPKQPQSWNRYSYVGNNPVGRTDPTGKCGEPADFVGPVQQCASFREYLQKYAAYEKQQAEDLRQHMREHPMVLPQDDGIHPTGAEFVVVAPLAGALRGVATAAVTDEAGAAIGAQFATAESAQNVANGVRLAGQLQLESANSAFAANGELSEGALAGSRQIIPASSVGNAAVPEGFAKYATETLASPSGPFQVHFYMNPETGVPFYGIDYKVVFNLP
jgi:RHS repeat-associated protein